MRCRKNRDKAILPRENIAARCGIVGGWAGRRLVGPGDGEVADAPERSGVDSFERAVNGRLREIDLNDVERIPEDHQIVQARVDRESQSTRGVVRNAPQDLDVWVIGFDRAANPFQGHHRRIVNAGYRNAQESIADDFSER